MPGDGSGVNVEVFCRDCGYRFADAVQATALGAARPPCPECGSTRRHGTVLASVHVAVEATSKGQGNSRESGARSKSKSFVWFYERFEVYRMTNRRQWVSRVFNKRDDLYAEEIRDAETGEVVRQVNEPLSEHQGHGSANKKQRNDEPPANPLRFNPED